MLNTFQQRTSQVGDSVVAASRQVWLAGLGAAVVTRGWAEKEAGSVLRNLVREGTAVESRAIRFVGDQVESSVAKANAVWKSTRSTVETVVRAYADTATALVRHSLSKSTPGHALSEKPAERKRVAQRARKAVSTPVAKRSKRSISAKAKR